MPTVCLIGGSGFLGRHVASQLCRSGLSIRIPTRRRERVKPELIVLPDTEVIEADVNHSGSLGEMIADSDIVINLAGILNEDVKGDFQRIHAELPRRVVDACRSSGVTRLIHVSALKASHEAPSEYLRSKAAGEQQIRAAEANGVRTTIFRPSVMFGRGDSFLRVFAALADRLPVIPLACPDARFQPVFVENVSSALVRCIGNPSSFSRTFDLCGPRAYCLRDLLEMVCEIRGRRRTILPLTPALSRIQAWILERLPGKLMSTDNIRSMLVDNVCDGNSAPVGFVPQALETVAPLYLSPKTTSQMDHYRLGAGR